MGLEIKALGGRYVAPGTRDVIVQVGDDQAVVRVARTPSGLTASVSDDFVEYLHTSHPDWDDLVIAIEMAATSFFRRL